MESILQYVTASANLILARAVIEAQAFSRLLGARVAEFSDGYAVLELDITENLLQQNGFVHGGVLAYAADNTITLAGATKLGPSVLTAGMTIDYLRPGTEGRLVARSTVVQAGRRRAVCRCDVHTVAVDGRDVVRHGAGHGDAGGVRRCHVPRDMTPNGSSTSPRRSAPRAVPPR